MRFEDIEVQAETLLRALDLVEPPIPVERIAQKHLIRIHRAPHKSFSGMLIRKDGGALIGVSSSESPTRQRFTIAHELGHFFLHPRKAAFVDFRDNVQNAIRTPREREANWFAAALLMPRRMLTRDCRALSKRMSRDDVGRLARRYQVSEEAMQFRLDNLSLLPRTSAK